MEHKFVIISKPMTFPGLVTYRVLFNKPYSPAVCHSLEHFFSHYLHESFPVDFISFNILSSRTCADIRFRAFHPISVVTMLRDSLSKMLKATKVPNATKSKCSNYRSHNLEGALSTLQELYTMILTITSDYEQFLYITAHEYISPLSNAERV